MSDFKKRLLASREEVAEVGGFKFTIRRPGALRMAVLRDRYPARFEFVLALVREAVVGWSGVKEEHLVPGGGDEPVPFDAELLMEWLEIRDDLWSGLMTAVMASIDRFRERHADSGNA